MTTSGERQHAAALAELVGWAAPDDDQEQLRAAYVGHLRSHPDGLRRGCIPAHLTASALILDAAGEHVLLTLHRKGGFWVQTGGHCEPTDVSLRAAALREAVEESGIADLTLIGDGPVDLHRHILSQAFGTCGEHLDVRYAVLAPAGALAAVSEESDDVAWFGVHDLPTNAVADLPVLVARAVAAQLTGSSSDRSSAAVAETPSR